MRTGEMTWSGMQSIRFEPKFCQNRLLVSSTRLEDLWQESNQYKYPRIARFLQQKIIVESNDNSDGVLL